MSHLGVSTVPGLGPEDPRRSRPDRDVNPAPRGQRVLDPDPEALADGHQQYRGEVAVLVGDVGCFAFFVGTEPSAADLGIVEGAAVARGDAHRFAIHGADSLEGIEELGTDHVGSLAAVRTEELGDGEVGRVDG